MSNIVESKKIRKTVMDEQSRFKTDKVVVDTATENVYITGVIRRCLTACLLSMWLGKSKDGEYLSDDDDDKPLISRAKSNSDALLRYKDALKNDVDTCPLQWWKDHIL